MIKYLLLILISLSTSLAFGQLNSVFIDQEKAITVMTGYGEFIGRRDLERENYRRRISRESQILREKLEKFKFNSSAMSPSVKKTEEAELKKYSNVVRKLDFRLKSEIDSREEEARRKVKVLLGKEIIRFGKRKKIKVIFDSGNEKVIYRARGVSPLTVKVFKQEKNIPDYTEKFMEYESKRNGTLKSTD